MKDKILQLCKRLNKFTLDEISTISEIAADDLLPIVHELISENKLTKNQKQYIYCKQKTISTKYPAFQYYSKETINLIIRCFCSGISTTKTMNIVEICHSSVENFYKIFRKMLYERQLCLLKQYYCSRPQIHKTRRFFNEIDVYFYIYGNQVFVVEMPFKSKDAKLCTNTETQEFKKIYSYVRRDMESHIKNKTNLEHKIAESIWRRNKDYKCLYGDLTNLINNQQTLLGNEPTGFCSGGQYET